MLQTQCWCGFPANYRLHGLAFWLDEIAARDSIGADLMLAHALLQAAG